MMKEHEGTITWCIHVKAKPQTYTINRPGLSSNISPGQLLITRIVHSDNDTQLLQAQGTEYQASSPPRTVLAPPNIFPTYPEPTNARSNTLRTSVRACRIHTPRSIPMSWEPFLGGTSGIISGIGVFVVWREALVLWLWMGLWMVGLGKARVGAVRITRAKHAIRFKSKSKCNEKRRKSVSRLLGRRRINGAPGHDVHVPNPSASR